VENVNKLYAHKGIGIDGWARAFIEYCSSIGGKFTYYNYKEKNISDPLEKIFGPNPIIRPRYVK
jgi:hypothetical protein